MGTHYVSAPAAGVVLASVLSADRSPVTVYSNAGLSVAVSLPLALTGATTVYVPDVPEWRARVTTPDGLIEPPCRCGSRAPMFQPITTSSE